MTVISLLGLVLRGSHFTALLPTHHCGFASRKIPLRHSGNNGKRRVPIFIVVAVGVVSTGGGPIRWISAAGLGRLARLAICCRVHCRYLTFDRTASEPRAAALAVGWGRPVHLANDRREGRERGRQWDSRGTFDR